jgi:hypothetical protein
VVIIIFASDEAKFINNKEKLVQLGYSSQKIIFADSKKKTRLDVIKENSSEWLLFLDHDCILTKSQSVILNTIISNLNFDRPKNQIVAGLYANSKQSNSIQKAHNWIANTWLNASYIETSKFPSLLGGVFLIFSDGVVDATDLGVGVWGAEDKYLALKLQQVGFKFSYKPELQVEHLTTKSLKHFFKRAYLHGVNDAKYFNRYPQGSNFLYWLCKIDYLDVRLVVLVVLHFFVQRAAKIFQTFRQMNK